MPPRGQECLVYFCLPDFPEDLLPHKLPDWEAGFSGVSVVTSVPLAPRSHGAMPRTLTGAVPRALKNTLGDLL